MSAHSSVIVVKYACNGNPYGTEVGKYIREVQGYENIKIYRKGRSWVLKEHNSNLRG